MPNNRIDVKTILYAGINHLNNFWQGIRLNYFRTTSSSALTMSSQTTTEGFAVEVLLKILNQLDADFQKEQLKPIGTIADSSPTKRQSILHLRLVSKAWRDTFDDLLRLRRSQELASAQVKFTNVEYQLILEPLQAFSIKPGLIYLNKNAQEKLTYKLITPQNVTVNGTINIPALNASTPLTQQEIDTYQATIYFELRNLLVSPLPDEVEQQEEIGYLLQNKNNIIEHYRYHGESEENLKKLIAIFAALKQYNDNWRHSNGFYFKLREHLLEQINERIVQARIKHDPLINIGVLNLQGLYLTRVPLFILNIHPGLIKLALSRNRLKKLPSEIGNILTLDSLYLDNNILDSLPQQIDQLKCLLVLNLQNNQFESVPPGITQMTKLEVLFLAKNKLKTLPEAIPDEILHEEINKLWIPSNRNMLLANQKPHASLGSKEASASKKSLLRL